MLIITNLLDTLLTIGTERKSFDIGFIRILGESKIGIVVMISLEALMFSLPAFLLSLAFTIPILALV